MKPYLTPEQKAEIARYFPDEGERNHIRECAKEAGIGGLDNPNRIIALGRVLKAWDLLCQNEAAAH